jgi:hypothetical protein
MNESAQGKLGQRPVRRRRDKLCCGTFRFIITYSGIDGGVGALNMKSVSAPSLETFPRRLSNQAQPAINLQQ